MAIYGRDNKQSFETGSLAIDVPGTAQQLTAHYVPQGQYLTVHADPDNDGDIYIGESKAKAEAHHFTLTPDASLQLAVDNVSDVWADAEAQKTCVVEWIVEIANEDV